MKICIVGTGTMGSGIAQTEILRYTPQFGIFTVPDCADFKTDGIGGCPSLSEVSPEVLACPIRYQYTCAVSVRRHE